MREHPLGALVDEDPARARAERAAEVSECHLRALHDDAARRPDGVEDHAGAGDADGIQLATLVTVEVLGRQPELDAERREPLPDRVEGSPRDRPDSSGPVVELLRAARAGDEPAVSRRKHGRRVGVGAREQTSVVRE